jgi:hypothetical protein
VQRQAIAAMKLLCHLMPSLPAVGRARPVCRRCAR